MLRRAACIVLALTLNSTVVRAQDTALTITADGADVFKAPSNVTPVIGHVSRGTVLLVSRNLGSWVRVPWPAAADGVGYVHVTMGRLNTVTTDRSISSAPHSTATDGSTPSEHDAVRADILRVAQRGAETTPASHSVGVGAIALSTSNYGGTVRAWRRSRVGVELGFTREPVTNEFGRATLTQIEPGVVYGLLDRVTDYVWVRPYVGTVASWRRQSATSAVPDAAASATATTFGFRAFGGAELTFATVPQFGLSADLGYRRYSSSFPGVDTKPLAISIAGHWYIR